MDICGNCGNRIDSSSKFCSGCGTQVTAEAEPQQQRGQPPYPSQPQFAPTPLPPQYAAQGYNLAQEPRLQQSGIMSSHHQVARGFAQTFGLHPAMALLTVVVNTMAFTGGLVIPVGGWLLSIPLGIVLAIIVYKGQKKWYDDDHESALIKALIAGFLTAIPTSLPGYLTIPAGILGFFRRSKS